MSYTYILCSGGAVCFIQAGTTIKEGSLIYKLFSFDF